MVLTAVTSAVAQQQSQTNQVGVGTNTVEAPYRTSHFLLTEPETNPSDHAIIKKKIRISGPLVGPATAKSLSDFTHRVVHLVNPFATDEFKSRGAQAAPVSNRAWSTIAGWSPGRSAFPTEAHHEPPMLRLISVSVEKEP